MLRSGFREGESLRAAELQSLADQGRRAAGLRVSPPLTLRETPAGRVLGVPSALGRPTIWAKILDRDEDGRYTWLEQVPASGGGWVDGSRGGTPTQDPAYEVNGRAVPDDSIVILRPGRESPADWRFRYQRALPQTVPGRICLYGCNGLQLHASFVPGLVVTIDGVGVSLTPGAACLDTAVTPGVDHDVSIQSTWFDTLDVVWDFNQDLHAQLTPKSTYRCCLWGPRPWPETLYCETPWGTATLTASGPSASWYGEIEGTETAYNYPLCQPGATVVYGLNFHCVDCLSPGAAQPGWCFHVGSPRHQCGTCADGFTAKMVPLDTADPKTGLATLFARGVLTAAGGGSTLDLTFEVPDSGITEAFCGINYTADFAGTYVVTE